MTTGGKGEITMNQILILTRNVLAEEQIQQKLQSLNYEVYSSSNIFNFYRQQKKGTIFLKFFQYVILSETLSEAEVAEVLPLLSEYPVAIIRMVRKKVTELEQDYLSEDKLNAIITSGDSSDELRECFYTLGKAFGGSGNTNKGTPNKKVIQLSGRASMMQSKHAHSFEVSEEELSIEERRRLSETLQRLTLTESRILNILIQAGDQIVDREEICRIIWNGEVNDSHKASLSSTITRIKNKFEQTYLERKAIHTVWGKGYRINIDLLEKIKTDETLSRILSSGKILSGV